MTVLVLWILISGFLDCYTTYRGLQIPGVVEKNPVLKYMMTKLGVIKALFVMKLIFFVCLFLIYYFNFYAYWIFLGVSIIYVFVLINNFWVLQKFKP